MNIRTPEDAGKLSPEMIAAMTAAVRAFLEQDADRASERRYGISAWRRVAHAGFGPPTRGWRARD